MKSPLLFLVFNRPETTRRVFAAIRAARPPRLFVAADGPRPGRAGEALLCEEVRAIATSVDWPCVVKTLFRDGNLGCRAGVSSGITWFFENESEGVILEDDVLPLPGFFDFCDELLARYRDDDRVAMISGCNFIADVHAPPESFFFSRYTHIWGWAGWRRAWRHYDVRMSEWPAWRDRRSLAAMPGGGRIFEAYWRPIFDAVHAGAIDTWDYQWTFACWRRNALVALPRYNQTHNLGFGPDATHTTALAPAYVRSSRARPLPLPLIHPSAVVHDLRADALIDARAFQITLFAAIKRYAFSIGALRRLVQSTKTKVRNAAQRSS